MDNQELLQPLKNIKLVVTDFDGVLTDNRVWLNDMGEEFVACNRSDGWAARLLEKMEIEVVCISTEQNRVVEARCKKMKIDYFQGEEDKISCLKKVLKDRGLGAPDVLYIGNDTNDSECLSFAGIGVVPADAFGDVLPLAQIKTQSRGGEGVLREVTTMLMNARNA